MKKTTKPATNFSFPVSKGALLPFDTSNLKFIAFFVIFFALLTIPTIKISASTIFTDNFESYNFGNLAGQGGWTGGPGYQVSNEKVLEGVKAVKNSGFTEPTEISKLGTEIPAGKITFYLWIEATSSANYLGLRLRTTEGTYLPYGFGIFCSGNNCKVSFYDFWAGGWVEYADISIQQWHAITMEWSSDLDKVRIKLDNLEFSAWHFEWPNYEIRGAEGVRFNQQGGTLFYDYITEYPFGDISFSPIFSPSFPIDCQFTITSTSTLNSFNATGTITIPAVNIFHWFNFSVIAEDFNTAEKHYFSTSTSLDGGAIFNYSIPISLPAGAWKISYLLEGVYFETSFFATHWCEHTGIGTGLPLPTWKQITEAEFLGIEDCSSYPLLERLVCDLKNAIKRIFVPSAESITALKTTIDGLKNKAPMSYITITKDFFDDVKNGINSTQNLTFKILNKTGNVSFAFWDNTTNFAGENQSFKDIFKTFFIFLLIFSFLIWAIFYVRKIFK